MHDTAGPAWLNGSRRGYCQTVRDRHAPQVRGSLLHLRVAHGRRHGDRARDRRLRPRARYRRGRGGVPSDRSEAKVGESVYAVVLATIAAGLVAATFHTESRVDPLAASPKLRIRITAFDWQWRFDYPGGRSVVGKPARPAVLVVPAHREIEFEVTSRDPRLLEDLHPRRLRGRALPVPALPGAVARAGARLPLPLLDLRRHPRRPPDLRPGRPRAPSAPAGDRRRGEPGRRRRLLRPRRAVLLGGAEELIRGAVRFVDTASAAPRCCAKPCATSSPTTGRSCSPRSRSTASSSFVATGVCLTFFFTPSYAHEIYRGSYTPLRGQEVAKAYLSTCSSRTRPRPACWLGRPITGRPISSSPRSSSTCCGSSTRGRFAGRATSTWPSA